VATARRSTARAQEERAGWVLVAPIVAYLLVVFLVPVLFLGYLSIVRWSPLSDTTRFAGLAILDEVVTDAVFWRSLGNSAYLVLLAVPTTIVAALLVAVSLSSHSPLPFKAAYKAAYFLPFVASLTATAFIWAWIFNPAYGLLNALLALVGLPPLGWLNDTDQVLPAIALMYVWVRLGFNMAILLAGIENIPREIYEAARIDGAGGVRSFWHVTLPLLNAQLVLVGVVEVVNALRTFDLPYVATRGGPLNASRTIVLHIYETAFKYDGFSKAAAAALLLFALILAVTIVQIRLTTRRVEY
jgi:multiple sugar transport system permease protein